MTKENKEKKNSKNISGDGLNDVSGGYVLYAGNNAGVRSKPYEVIHDADGSVLGRYATRDEVVAAAPIKQQSSKSITMYEVDQLRNSDTKGKSK